MVASSVTDDQVKEFLAREYGKVVVALSIVTGASSLAEDAVQEALARAVQEGERGAHIENLSAWVTVVARNVTRSWMRRLRAEDRAKRRYLDAPAMRSPDVLDAVEVAWAVRALRPRQREAIALFYFADLPVRDIAVAMKLQPKAVKALLHRGRRELAAALALQDEAIEGEIYEST